MPGKLIVIEGPDGSGKTTLVKNLKGLLLEQGIATLTSREPGAVFDGELRRLIINVGAKSSLAELFMFLADRAEHVKTVVKPALAEGKWVILDRFTDSTIAYQWFGRATSSPELRRAFDNDFDRFVKTVDGAAGIVPDLRVLVHTPRAIAAERLRARQQATDVMESNGDTFFAEIRRYYNEVMPYIRNHQSVVTVYGGNTPEMVAAIALSKIFDHFDVRPLAS